MALRGGAVGAGPRGKDASAMFPRHAAWPCFPVCPSTNTISLQSCHCSLRLLHCEVWPKPATLGAFAGGMVGENSCLPSSSGVPSNPPHFHLRHPDVSPWEDFPAVRVPTEGLVVGGELPGP